MPPLETMGYLEKRPVPVHNAPGHLVTKQNSFVDNPPTPKTQIWTKNPHTVRKNPGAGGLY